MIMRIFLIFGLALLGGTAYFVVIAQPPTFQDVPATGEISRLQQQGILPMGPFVENEEIEHDIFGVPPKDEEMLQDAMANMDMGDMDMSGSGEMDTSGTDMTTEGDTMTTTEGDTMVMDGGETMDMSSADMTQEAGAADADSAVGGEEKERLEAGMKAGLIIRDEDAFDRAMGLSMTEWGFSDLKIDAKPGERIKFTLRNDGKVPHEFMFMSMAAMQAVNYRAKRADWNLLEHEALYEKSLLLPGEEITFVTEVLRPGAWMFMCMLPYHMQMGMMGQLATEGMAMEM